MNYNETDWQLTIKMSNQLKIQVYANKDYKRCRLSLHVKKKKKVPIISENETAY